MSHDFLIGILCGFMTGAVTILYWWVWTTIRKEEIPSNLMSTINQALATLATNFQDLADSVTQNQANVKGAIDRLTSQVELSAANDLADAQTIEALRAEIVILKENQVSQEAIDQINALAGQIKALDEQVDAGATSAEPPTE